MCYKTTQPRLLVKMRNQVCSRPLRETTRAADGVRIGRTNDPGTLPGRPSWSSPYSQQSLVPSPGEDDNKEDMRDGLGDNRARMMEQECVRGGGEWGTSAGQKRWRKMSRKEAMGSNRSQTQKGRVRDNGEQTDKDSAGSKVEWQLPLSSAAEVFSEEGLHRRLSCPVGRDRETTHLRP